MNSYDYTTHNTGSSVGNVSVTMSVNPKPNKQFQKKQPYVTIARNSLRYIDLTNEDKDVTHNITLLDYVKDGDVQAYVFNTTGAEVKLSPNEGMYVIPSFFRVASFPIMQTEDMEFVSGLKDHAIQQANEAIWRQEDYHFVQLLDSAIDQMDDEWKTDHCVSGWNVEQIDFDLAKGIIGAAELPVSKLLVNPLDIPYFNVDFMSAYVGVWESVSIPRKRAYLITHSDYLGAFVTLYGIKKKENERPEEFKEGVVLDEMISMMLLNPDGVVRFQL